MRTISQDGEFVPPWVCFIGGSSPAGNTTTTTNSSPWQGESGYLSGDNTPGWAPLANGSNANDNGSAGIYGSAQALYENPSDWAQYYPSDTYAPITDQQTGLMSNLINATDTGGTSGLQAANTNLTDVLNPDYTSQSQGTFDTGNTLLGSELGTGFTQPQQTTFNSGNSVLGTELSSSYLNPANSPTYSTAISNALAQALPSATASFVNGNRSDSGLASAAAASAATNAAAGLAQNQYNTNQNIQNQAVNTASGNLATQEGLQGQAANTASSNLLTQQGNQVKDLLTAPGIDQATTSDLGTALSTAGMAQTNNQNQINADVARYNYGQMLPYNQLSMYEGAITGAGNPGGTTTETQPYFENPTSNILGTATGILGLNGLTGSAGGGFGSTLLGSAGSSLLDMIGISDQRAKTDIERVGESDSGFPLYLFRYKGEGPMSRHIGLMAQDVEKERPEAVITLPSGYKAVNYGRALMSDYLVAA